MKKLLSCLLLLACLPVAGQVVVTLQSKYQGNLVNLDAIVVQNLSQPGTLTLAAPAGVTTYHIDLMKGSFLGLSEPFSTQRVRILSQMPGRTTLSVAQETNGPVQITLYTLTGALYRHWDENGTSGMYEIDLRAGTNQMLVGRVSGSGFSFSFKMTGSPESVTSCTVSHRDGVASLKSALAFHYTPGDKVAFTAVKSGMNRGRTALVPQNLDSVVILLSVPCPGALTVADFDGNDYGTVQIGNQCWMTENLRTKHYANGQPLIDGTGVAMVSETDTNRYWFHMNDNPSTALDYGLLYTAIAAMDHALSGTRQGVCPNGWHVATADDWCAFEQFIDPTYTDCSIVPSPLYQAQWGGTVVRDKIMEQGSQHWTCTGSIPAERNESGFTALPNCGRLANGFYTGLGGESTWWGPSVNGGSSQVPIRGIVCDSIGDYRTVSPANNGLPVRCIKN